MSAASDVVVIGGGVFGSSVAYALARGGASVTLLDAALPGRATAASAGGLWPLGEALGLGCGVIFHNDEESDETGPQPLPRAFMEFLCASNQLFAGLGPELRELSGIDIENETETGLLYLLYDDSQRQHARDILEFLDHDQRLAEEWSPKQVWERDPHVTRDLLGAMHFPGDNQVNPMLLADAYKRSAMALGAKFVAEAKVHALELRGDRVLSVHSTQGTYPCGSVVNAAGAWAARVAALAGAPLPVTPIRGQIVCLETLEEHTLRSNLSTKDCYLLQKAHGEVIIGSTTEHVDFQTEVQFETLCDLAAGAGRAVPALLRAAVKRSWSGLRPGTPDEFPILGRASQLTNFYHATGGFRTGIVAAPLSAALVAAQILDQPSPTPIEPFLARRFEVSREPVFPSTT